MGRFQKLIKGAIAGGAGMAALAAVNAKIARDSKAKRALEDDVDSVDEHHAREIYSWTHGNILYRVAGEKNAPPLVLIHGIGTGASNFMWRKNFVALTTDFRVYAPDLLGFGFSDKPALSYTAELYVLLLIDFLRDVVQAQSSAPARIVASGLSAAFAVHVAEQSPELIAALTLIAPRIADDVSARPGMSGAAFYGLLNSPVLGTSFYNATASERGIRDFARAQLFYDKRFVTPRFIANRYAMSHQSGAQHAVSAYVSGFLNTDARRAFAHLKQPVTLLWGRQDTTTPPAQAAALLRLNARAHLEVFDQARMWAHYEHAERFNTILQPTIHKRRAAA